jgi:hypothetical protein
MKKFFGWVVLALALACFALALVTIAARFGGDVMLICLFSGIGFGALGIGNKMIA